MAFPLGSDGMDGINLVTTYAGGARQQSTPSLQALAGLYLVASLLGHIRKNKPNTVFLCTNSAGKPGLPTLQNPGRRSHTQQHARARYGWDRRMKDPRPGMARNEHQKGHLPGWRGLNGNVKDG